MEPRAARIGTRLLPPSLVGSAKTAPTDGRATDGNEVKSGEIKLN